MALINLEGHWGVPGLGGGGSAVLRECRGRGLGSGDHQKLETKPRSLQDNYQDYKPFILKTCASNLHSPPQSTTSGYGTVDSSSTVVVQ